jgi:hypothetical protein
MNAHPLGETGWKPRRWLSAVLLLFALQVILIFWLGERPRVLPVPTGNGFTWRIAGPAWGEILALQDPTLFLLPHRNGFSGPAWMKTPGLPASAFFWTEGPRLLTLSDRDLGSTFNRFVATNKFGTQRMKPLQEPTITLPEVPKRILLPASSSLRMEGPLAGRSFVTKPQLRSWPHTELLTNSVIQLLIDEEGKPVTPGTLLVSSGYAPADAYALEQVRTTRFNPLINTAAPSNTWGLLIFEWTTSPATNAPPPNPGAAKTMNLPLCEHEFCTKSSWL